MAELKKRAAMLLERVGLANKKDTLPGKLSIGEQQRIAVVRAVINKPVLLLADEPTASLDAENSRIVLGLLRGLCSENGTALILSTHDESVKEQFDEWFDIKGGRSGLTAAAEPFPIVAGSKGSPNQLVLNTVFLKDTPMSNISYTEVEKLRANKNVAMAVPLGYGDNYRGFRMAGTEKEIFNYVINPQRGKWLQINEGARQVAANKRRACV